MTITINARDAKTTNVLTQFIIEGKVFGVIGTDHALKRLARRGIDQYQAASAVMALGKKLLAYNDSGKQIIIPDVSKNMSTIFCVEKYTIVLITVLDKSNPYVKDNTIIESFDNMNGKGRDINVV